MLGSFGFAALAVAITALSACSSTSSPTRDSAAEIGPRDATSEAPGDAALDGADARTDLAPDFPQASEALTDFPATDALLSSARVLYISTKDVHAFGLREVPADGSKAPKAVAGFSGLIDFGSLLLSGLGEQIAIDSGRPRVEELVDFSRVVLPGTAGSLYYFHRTLTASSGILQIESVSGTLRILHEVPGLYSDVLGPHLAIDAAVKRAAVVAPGARVAVMRLDGMSFPSGKAAHVFDPPADVTQLESGSLTLAGGAVYVVGRRQNGTLVLLRGELTAPTLTAVPLGGTTEPSYLAPDITLSADGSTLLLRAGPDFSKLDIYRVVPSSGQVLRVTQVETAIAARGERFGGAEARLAISPQGSRVAYAVRDGSEKLYLQSTDGAGQPVELTAEPTFAAGGISALYNVVFIDEDRLLLMGGVGSFQLDLYHYDASSGLLTNLTGVGSTTKPFDGMGGFSPRAAWIDRVGGWFYAVLYDTVTTEQNLYALPLKPSTGTLRKLTSGRRLGSQPGDFAHCASSKMLYFAARPDPSKYAHELWQVDLLSGLPAQPLTGVAGGGPWIFGDLHLASDCSRLVAAGGPYYGQTRLWSLSTAAPTSVWPITTIPQVLTSTVAITPDGSTVVYGSGGSAEAMTVKTVLSSGSVATTLDPTGGKIFVLGAFTP